MKMTNVFLLSILMGVSSCAIPELYTGNMRIASSDSTGLIRYFSVEGPTGYTTISDEGVYHKSTIGRSLIFQGSSLTYESLLINDSLKYTCEFHKGNIVMSYIRNERTCLVSGIVNFYNHAGSVQIIAQYKDGIIKKILYSGRPKASRRFMQNAPFLRTCSVNSSLQPVNF
jgi:hypothetical protein